MDGAGQPHLEALCKVAYGLSEGARYRMEYVGNEEVHDALVEQVVTCTDIVYDERETRQQEELLFRELVLCVVVWTSFS